MVFKIVAVGESGVGKTCLIHNYVKGTFKVDYSVTVGVEFYTKNLHIDGNHIQLQIWDTVTPQTCRRDNKHTNLSSGAFTEGLRPF